MQQKKQYIAGQTDKNKTTTTTITSTTPKAKGTDCYAKQVIFNEKPFPKRLTITELEAM